MLFSLAHDFDGAISHTLDHYLKDERLTPSLERLSELFSKFRDYMLREHIVVREIKADNIILQRLNQENARLILIDGLGNNQLLTIANYISTFARKLILRKWSTFERYLDLPPLTRPLTLGKSRLLFCEILPGSGRLNRCAV